LCNSPKTFQTSALKIGLRTGGLLPEIPSIPPVRSRMNFPYTRRFMSVFFWPLPPSALCDNSSDLFTFNRPRLSPGLLLPRWWQYVPPLRFGRSNLPPELTHQRCGHYLNLLQTLSAPPYYSRYVLFPWCPERVSPITFVFNNSPDRRPPPSPWSIPPHHHGPECAR